MQARRFNDPHPIGKEIYEWGGSLSARAYYNEIDPFAADWLRELMRRGFIADGEIDTRSIVDVRAEDVAGFTRCHFFAGIGGWDYALQLAEWPSDRPVWTGSCPCQPFSLAGTRQGFDDSRHLWPQFARLIKDASPATIFGEQVASATDWLGLVRGDLDAMGYAVGTMPIEAASAGADHLRDRFWFVADNSGHGRRERRTEHEVRRGRSTTSCHGGVVNTAGIGQREQNDKSHTLTASREARGLSGGAGDYSGVSLAGTDHPRSQGRVTERERANQRSSGPHGMAHAHKPSPSEERQQRSGEFSGASGNPESCLGCDMADGNGIGERGRSGEESQEARSGQGEVEGHFRQRDGLLDSGTRERFEWVTGADGKARRVKSGIRLLAHGIPNRVGSLRGFGNAIDPRPASDFIQAFLQTESPST